jgi:chromosome segregation ATPase
MSEPNTALLREASELCYHMDLAPFPFSITIASWADQREATLRSRLEAAERERDANGLEAHQMRTQRDKARSEAANWLRLHNQQEDRAEAAESSLSKEREDRKRLREALTNLAHEMRYVLRRHPKMDGGLYRQRLTEADAALKEGGAA